MAVMESTLSNVIVEINGEYLNSTWTDTELICVLSKCNVSDTYARVLTS